MRTLIAFTLLAVSAVAELPRHPAKIGGTVVPLPTPNKPTADRHWADVAHLIDAVPPFHVSGPFPGTTPNWSGYVLFQEMANRTLREAGLKFAETYPDDPRVWTWLAETRRRHPQYVSLEQVWASEGASAGPEIDHVAREKWQAAYRALLQRAIIAEDAPPALRLELRIEDLNWRMSPATNARVARTRLSEGEFDFESMGEGITRLGIDLPEAADPSIRSLVAGFMRDVRWHAPELEAKWIARWRDNPNKLIRDMALGYSAIEHTRNEPLEMAFTAMDGREVDLAKLRGKVVLVEFRGVTWCGACRDEEPYLKEAYARFRDQFEIVTITYEMRPSDHERVQRYLKEKGLEWPHYFDGKGDNNPFVRQFAVTGVPDLFLLDQTGRLADRNVRQEKLIPAIERLLAK